MDTLENIMLGALWLCVAIVVGLLVWAGFILYGDAHAEKFELIKTEWTCSASHDEVSTSFQKIGEVNVPIDTTTVVCDQWSRVK